MAITFHPKPAMVLMCDYGTGFMPPEMVKKRRVIVISSYQVNKRGLCTVVPISTTPPIPQEPHHYLLPAGKYKFLHTTKDCWVKTDMITRVGLARLDRVRIGHHFTVPAIGHEDLIQIKKCFLTTLDIDWQSMVQST